MCPLDKVVVFGSEEFKSTWVGIRAYIGQDGCSRRGVIVWPGVKQFGEDEEIGKLSKIWLYGRENILKTGT
jgi:hypothetical protein